MSLWHFLCHFFNSPLQNESLVLSGADGIRFEQAMDFPRVEEPSESPAMAAQGQKTPRILAKPRYNAAFMYSGPCDFDMQWSL